LWIFLDFIKDHPEFNTVEFQEYVIAHNRADRDSGELIDIAESEITRLAGEFAEEHGIKWSVRIRKRIESPTWEEVLAADGMGGIWEEELAKKKRPQDYPKGRFHLDNHFRGASCHKDLRIKMNDHLRGWSIVGDEIIPVLVNGKFKLKPIEKLYQEGWKNAKSLSFDFQEGKAVWRKIENIFPSVHQGEIIRVLQNRGSISVSPNHSLMNDAGEKFLPDEKQLCKAIRNFEIPSLTEFNLGFSDMLFENDRAYFSKNKFKDQKSEKLRIEVRYRVDDEKLRDFLRVLAWYIT
ncbi:unnamed protein product, partial [marine sediment metagenome]